MRNPIFQMLCYGSRPVKRVKKDEVHAAARKECFSLKAVVRSGIKMSHPPTIKQLRKGSLFSEDLVDIPAGRGGVL